MYRATRIYPLLPVLRVGKVSIEVISEASFRKSQIMRTRPRPSDMVARCVGRHKTRTYTQEEYKIPLRGLVPFCDRTIAQIQIESEQIKTA